MVVGVATLVIIIAFLGCCGSLKESQCMLVSVRTFLNTVFIFRHTIIWTTNDNFTIHFLVLLFLAGCFGGRNRNRRLCLPEPRSAHEDNTHQCEAYDSEWVWQHWTSDRSFQCIPEKCKHFDSTYSYIWIPLNHICTRFDCAVKLMQFIPFIQLECCGVDGPLDWQTSKYNNNTKAINLDVSSPEAMFIIPESCCKQNVTLDVCKQATRIKVGTTKLDQLPSAKYIHQQVRNEFIQVFVTFQLIDCVVHWQGCSERLQREAENHLLCILAIVAGIIAIEIFALMISLCLCCAVGDREDDYKS